jgi:PAS domain S-box-containing protein
LSDGPAVSVSRFYLPSELYGKNGRQRGTAVKGGAYLLKSLATLKQYAQSLTYAWRLRGPLAENPTARTLHALLLSFAIWFGFWSIVLLIVYPNLARLALDILYQATLVAALVLLRYGFFPQASLVYLAGMWVSATARIAIGAGIHSTTQVVYVTLPILATWLLGYRAAMWTAGTCLGSSLVFACLELVGVRAKDPITATPLATWSIMLQVTLMGVVPVAHVLRSLQASLARSRRSEQILTADLIDRLRAEDKLREALQQLQLITENMAAGVTRCSRDLRYIWVSPSFAAWMGGTQEEIAGRLILDVIGREAYETILPYMEKVLSGDREEYEAQVNYIGVGLRWIHAVYVPTKGADHKVNGWIEVVTDITDARRSRQESFAKQKLESVGTLASGIAHDFNNLLGAVLAQAELAVSEFAAGVNPGEELRAIQEVALRGSEIVRQLMIYAGKESPVIGPVDVSETIRDMVELLKVSVSKHVVLEMELSPDLPAVQANAAQLRQIILNLITNASDAIGDQDGVICVTTRGMKDGQELPGGISGGLADGDCLELEISDTGHGMTLETQAKVFDPFFTTKSAGHGLGLAIVHRIVQGFGGAIHLTSEVGKGTTFQIRLPYDQVTVDTTKDGAPSSEEVAIPGREAIVLVVEDEDPLRSAIVKMLRKSGFEVLEAGNGSAAIRLLRANGDRIDVILLDMTIPGPSSREVVAEAVQTRPDVSVVLTSAYSEEMIKDAMGAPQIHGFIRKPFRLGDLVQKLREVLM